MDMDARNKTTTYTYNEMDKIVEVKDPMGNITRYSYGATRNLLSVTDAKSQTIRYEYDERGRIKKMTDQLGKIKTYNYYTGAEITPLTGDNLKSITDRKGQTTTFNEYDSMDRVKKITYHDGSFTTYTYDAVGRLITVTDTVTGTISYTYNDFGCTTCGGRGMDRIAQEVTPIGTIDYTYDNVGRRKTMTVLGQPAVPVYIQKLLNEFKTWLGTPYKTGGSKKGANGGADCSHSTHQGYTNAGFPYEYSTTREFTYNDMFKLSPGNTPQVGDVALWKGHMAVYAGNGQIYTAHRPGGASYSLESLSDWMKYNKVSDPTWFRYYKPD
jgi:YD repeat-containing protein